MHQSQKSQPKILYTNRQKTTFTPAIIEQRVELLEDDHDIYEYNIQLLRHKKGNNLIDSVSAKVRDGHTATRFVLFGRSRSRSWDCILMMACGFGGSSSLCMLAPSLLLIMYSKKTGPALSLRQATVSSPGSHTGSLGLDSAIRLSQAAGRDRGSRGGETPSPRKRR
jgi:hypothetical protein